MTEYEDKFVEIYKEADELGHEVEVGKEKEWEERCQKLKNAAEQAQQDIDKDINKLSETKRLFSHLRVDEKSCRMISYYIEEDCLNHPEKCPAGVKELMKKEIQIGLRDRRNMLKWAEEEKPESIEFYKERIKEDEEKIKRLS